MKTIRTFHALAVVLFISLGAARASVAIRVDQVGYLPDESKIAVIEEASGSRFRILNARSRGSVFSGVIGRKVYDPDTGRSVRQADFSAVTQKGAYILELPGQAASDPFTISDGVFHQAAYLSMRSFYGQRCGTQVDLGPDFPGYSYGPCHTGDALFHKSAGRNGKKRAVGGWHDAGDYGKYVVNSGISTGTLLYAWEFYGSLSPRLILDLPPSDRKVPDFLAEVKWNLDWMLSMQDKDGGVYHKLTSENFCGFIPPEKDTGKRFIIGTGQEPYKSSAATGDFAAVMAIASRVYRPESYDRGFSDKCLKAAEKAWAWLSLHPDVTFRNPSGIRTGNYGDGDCTDERFWAAVELWRATGGENYHRYVIDQVPLHVAVWVDAKNPPAWPQLGALALWSYALSGRKDGDPATVEIIRKATLSAAREVAGRTAKSPWRHSMLKQNYIWGSNSVALNYSILLLMADRMEPRKEFRDAAMDNLHYVLGRNAFGVSWVTGLGTNPFRYPHHRPSASSPPGKPWPGLISGGPNAGKQDPVLGRLPASTPPALCWLDEQGSYAGNEVAINWNAPLVFVLFSTLPVGDGRDVP